MEKKNEIVNLDFFVEIERFNTRLNTPPPDEEIQKAPDGSLYVPISYIETNLDELFFGLWETVNFTWKPIANELVGQVELRVFHPIAKTWITKTGAAATQIRLSKGAEITDIGKKIRNALEKDHPHLLSDCIKNAAKRLGKRFGRDLNRAFEDTYDPIIETAAKVELAEAECQEATTIKDLIALFNENPEWQRSQSVMSIFTKRKKEIQNGITEPTK